MANDPLTPEGLLAGVLRLRVQRVERERDAAIDLLRRLVSDLESLCTCGSDPEDEDGCECPEPWAQKHIDEARALLAAIDGAPAPAESEA